MANTAHLPKYDERGRRLQSFGHGDVEPITADDSSNQLIGMAIRTLKSGKGGSMGTYPNTEEGFDMFKAATVAYLEEVRQYNSDESHEQKMLLDIESWCITIGISRRTLCTYYAQRSQTWKDFIDLVKTGILATKKDFASRGKTPPILLIFDAVNNFSYRNTSDIRIETETTNKLYDGIMSTEEIRKRIEEDIPIDTEPEPVEVIDMGE